MKKICICLFMIFAGNEVFSQNFIWQQTSTNNSEVLAVSGNTLYAAGGNELYFSINKGTTWTRLLALNLGDYIKAIALHGSDIYVGGSANSVGAVLRSGDFGQTWVNVTPAGITEDVRAILITGNDIYIGIRSPIQPQGIFKSSLTSLSSSSWSLFNTGLGNTSVMSLAASGPNVLAGTEGGGVWVSPASGANWVNAFVGTSLPQSNTIVNMSVNSSTVFACAHQSAPNLFKSTDSGATWSAVNSPVFSAGWLYGVFLNGSDVYAGFELGGGPVFSTDQGGNWTVKGNGLVTNQDKNIYSFALVGQTLFAAAMSGVWKYDVPTETSLAEREIQGKISIYPNPVLNGILHLSGDKSLNGYVTVINSIGQVAIKQSIINGQTNIDLTGSAKGIYTVIVSSGEHISTYKVVNQ